MRRRAPLLALVVLAACQADSPTDLMVTPSFAHVSGDLTHYDTRAAFEAAFPGLPTEDFQDGNIVSGRLDCARPLDSATDDACFSPGAIEDGVTFSTVGPDRAGHEFRLLVLFGTDDARLISSTQADEFTMDFSPAVTALGMDVLSGAYLNTCTIDVYGASGLLHSETMACRWATPPFFGLTSHEPITRVVMHGVKPDGTPALEGVDNLSFGQANPATKADCMNGGWDLYGFKNQGQCVRFVETGKDSRTTEPGEGSGV